MKQTTSMALMVVECKEFEAANIELAGARNQYVILHFNNAEAMYGVKSLAARNGQKPQTLEGSPQPKRYGMQFHLQLYQEEYAELARLCKAINAARFGFQATSLPEFLQKFQGQRK